MTDSIPPFPENAVPPPAPEVEVEILGPEAINAPIGDRILAVLIDGLLCLALLPVPIFGILLAIAYMLTRDALPFLDGQSLGKKVMKLRTVSSETHLPLTHDWSASIIRNIGFAVPYLHLPFAIVELVILSTNPEGRRLGDQCARTRVIIAPSR